MPELEQPAGVELSDDPERIDFEAVWAWLSTEAYWGRFRSRADVEKQVRGSWRVVGAYDSESGAMLGFARALSDGVNFAYLADVFVLEEAQGRGIGTALVAEMVENGPGSAFRWVLFTATAHSLYEKFGFAAPDHTAMVRPSANI